MSGPPSVASSIVDHQHHVHQACLPNDFFWKPFFHSLQFDFIVCHADVWTAERRRRHGRSNGRRRRPHAFLFHGDDGSPLESSECGLDRPRRSPNSGTLERQRVQRRARVGTPERLQRRSHVRRHTGMRYSHSVSQPFHLTFSTPRLFLAFLYSFDRLTDCGFLLAGHRHFPPPEHIRPRYGSPLCYVKPPAEAIQG